jgi:hypothetical protein
MRRNNRYRTMLPYWENKSRILQRLTVVIPLRG